MEVILLHDVERLGHEGELVKVADGYARNYLLPRGLAERATRANQRALEQRRRAIERRAAEKRDAAQGQAAQIVAAGVTLQVSVGEGGRLHGQVTSTQIARAINEAFGVSVDRRHIDIPTPIREVGEFTVTATLYKDVRCEVPIHVVSEGGEEAAEEPPAEEAAVEPAAEEAPAEAPAMEEAPAEEPAMEEAPTAAEEPSEEEPES